MYETAIVVIVQIMRGNKEAKINMRIKIMIYTQLIKDQSSPIKIQCNRLEVTVRVTVLESYGSRLNSVVAEEE